MSCLAWTPQGRSDALPGHRLHAERQPDCPRPHSSEHLSALLWQGYPRVGPLRVPPDSVLDLLPPRGTPILHDYSGGRNHIFIASTGGSTYASLIALDADALTPLALPGGAADIPLRGSFDPGYSKAGGFTDATFAYQTWGPLLCAGSRRFSHRT